MSMRLLLFFVITIFTFNTFADTFEFEKCGIQIDLLGQSTIQEQTVPLNPENTAHISNRTSVQELAEGRLVTAVMCVFITGEADAEKRAFQPAQSLQQMIARMEQSGITVADSKLLDADPDESHRRGFELDASQAGQPIYARGMFIQKPDEMLSYSVFVLGSSRLKAKMVKELRTTLASITPIPERN
ncbi:hypothetical protein NBRC116492_06460 [Aurantivibrio infirmus]